MKLNVFLLLIFFNIDKMIILHLKKRIYIFLLHSTGETGISES